MKNKTVPVAQAPKLIQAILKSWEKLNQKTDAATLKSLGSSLPRNWLDYVDIYDVEGDGAVFRLQKPGSRVIDLTNQNLWGRSAQDIDHVFGLDLHRDLLSVYTSKKPALHHIHVFQDPNKLSYRALVPVFCPNHPDQVEQILLCLVAK